MANCCKHSPTQAWSGATPIQLGVGEGEGGVHPGAVGKSNGGGAPRGALGWPGIKYRAAPLPPHSTAQCTAIHNRTEHNRNYTCIKSSIKIESMYTYKHTDI